MSVPLVQVWTASHLDHKERLSHLIAMIKSVQSCLTSVDIHISLSYNDEYDAKEIFATLQPLAVKLYLHDKPKKQIEHLAHIKQNNTSDKPVLFMDDDDLLLPEYLTAYASSKGKTMIGIQEGKNEIGRYVENNCIRDFSGYTTTRKYADIAITKGQESLFQSSADLEIMSYLNTLSTSIHEKPFIYRRTWDNPQSWKTNLMSELAAYQQTNEF